MSLLSRFSRKPNEPGADVEAVMARAHEAARTGDYHTALSIWGPLAQAGNARAQNNIGACFAGGFGVDRDAALALRWLTLSAEAGDPVGQRNLASLLFKGEGDGAGLHPRRRLLPQGCRTERRRGPGHAELDACWRARSSSAILDESRRWAMAAAANGVAASMTRLGMFYHNALGVPRDATEAISWWRRGADAGDADGQAMLGAACLSWQWHRAGSGRGAGLAHRARAGGSALAAPFIDAVRASLDAEELTLAERRARTPLPAGAAFS